jgi:hypothetical protein
MKSRIFARRKWYQTAQLGCALAAAYMFLLVTPAAAKPSAT